MGFGRRCQALKQLVYESQASFKTVGLSTTSPQDTVVGEVVWRPVDGWRRTCAPFDSGIAGFTVCTARNKRNKGIWLPRHSTGRGRRGWPYSWREAIDNTTSENQLPRFRSKYGRANHRLNVNRQN